MGSHGPSATGCLSVPASRRFFSPLQTAALPQAWPGGQTPSVTVGHVPFGGLLLGAITDAPPETVATSLLELRPPNTRPYLPGAGHLPHWVLVPSVPSQASGAHSVGMGRRGRR